MYTDMPAQVQSPKSEYSDAGVEDKEDFGLSYSYENVQMWRSQPPRR